jgi:hypothetical protein
MGANMKRTTVILCALALLGIACYAWARSTVVSVVQGAAAGCTFPGVTQSKTTADDYDRFGNGAYIWIATQFTTSQEYTTQVKVQYGVLRVGTPDAGVITAYIAADNGSDYPANFIDNPELFVAANATVDGSTVGTSEDYTTMTFIFNLSSPLSTSTKYWLVLKCPAYVAGDNSNCWNWKETTESGFMRNSQNGATWQALAAKPGDYKVYACN